MNPSYTRYYNRKSIRLRGYDYSRPGYYFLTLCIHDRKKDLFGHVAGGEMIYNEFGEYAQQCWLEIPLHFSNVQLDAWIVMPNHVHGIIRIIGAPAGAVDMGANNYSPPQGQMHHPRGTSKTIGSIVRGYKIGVTKMIHRKFPDLVVWQRNYFERIIRDERALYRIRRYIRKNPGNWREGG